MKISDYIVGRLSDYGVDTVFGYTGGSIADIIDSIYRNGKIRFVQNGNEQAAAFCANSYAQVSGRVGVAISSSGPGAINLLNGIANAYYDSVPCVFITGNVHSLSRRASRDIRQNGFQETDIVSMVEGITKYAAYVDDENAIGEEFDKAFWIANEGRRGPVLLDIPYDVQRKDVTPSSLRRFKALPRDDLECKKEAVLDLVGKSHRPVILAGGGCVGASRELRHLLQSMRIPVVVSMRGLDLVPHDEESYVGFIGSYGNRAANLAVRYSDLLLVLGSRLDERQMGYKKRDFAPNARIVQVDVDAKELGRKVDCELLVKSDVGLFLTELAASGAAFDFSPWTSFLKRLAIKYPSYDVSRYCASNFLWSLSGIVDDNAIVCVDVGQNQIISAQAFDVKRNQRFLCSAGLACMGYSLPAAIGACYAGERRQVISINGDGGLQMNMQELETISREKLLIKIVVVHNNCLGLIRKLQERIFDRRYYASVEGFSCPDLGKIADAYAMDYCRIENLGDYAKLDAALKSKRPCIIDAVFPVAFDADPEPGNSIFEQLPEIGEVEIRRIENAMEEFS